MCVLYFFVQPGVVSARNVTERISFVNSFAAVFRQGFFCPAHRASPLILNLKPTQTRLEGIRSNLEPVRSSQRLWTARVSSAIDDMAGNSACAEVLFEATFRQPRAGPLEFGP